MTAAPGPAFRLILFVGAKGSGKSHIGRILEQPLKDAFLRVNPDPQKLRAMHDKDAARMRSFQDVPDAAVTVDARLPVHLG